MTSPNAEPPKEENPFKAALASLFMPGYSTGEDAESKEKAGSRRNSRGPEDQTTPRSVPAPRDFADEDLAPPANGSSVQGSPLTPRGKCPDSSDGGEASPGQSKAPAAEGDDKARPEVREALTAFAEQLASATQRAPLRLAERLSDQLQQLCLEEASMGQSSYTWDTQLPSSSRSFMHQVARALATRLEALGFEQVEWWNGREWSKHGRQYHIIHDPVYEKYHMKIRVRWLDRLPPEELELAAEEAARRQAPPGEQSVLEQVQQWLEMQRQMLEQQVEAESHTQGARSNEVASASQPTSATL